MQTEPQDRNAFTGREHLQDFFATDEEKRAPFKHWAADPKLIVLDVLTTDRWGEVVEIAAVNAKGEVVFHSRIKPCTAVQEGAEKFHGISTADLMDAPTMDAVWPRLTDALRGKNAVMWNAAYDASRIAYSLDMALPGWRDQESSILRSRRWKDFCFMLRCAGCAMSAYAPIAGKWNQPLNNFMMVGLAAACTAQGLPAPVTLPTTISEAHTTLALIRKLGAA